MVSFLENVMLYRQKGGLTARCAVHHTDFTPRHTEMYAYSVGRARMNDLQLSDLPEIGDRKAILAFASSFHGYRYWGSAAACAEAARQSREKP